MDVIHLFGEVGWEITNTSVQQVLASTTGDTLIRISTVGGDVSHGVAVYEVIKAEVEKGRKIVTEAIGEVSSAGTLILQAGSVRAARMSTYGMYHLPWAMSAGNYKHFQKTSEDLRTIGEAAGNIYAAKLGGKEQAQSLMEFDGYLTAEQMKAANLIDVIIDADEKEQYNSRASARAQKSHLKIADMDFLEKLGITKAKAEAVVEPAVEPTPAIDMAAVMGALSQLTDSVKAIADNQAVIAEENENIKGALGQLATKQAAVSTRVVTPASEPAARPFDMEGYLRAKGLPILPEKVVKNHADLYKTMLDIYDPTQTN